MQEAILSYANGKGQKTIYSSEPNPETGECKRKDFKQSDFLSMDHQAPAMMYAYDEHHGGDDVGLWAQGMFLCSINILTLEENHLSIFLY